MTRTPVPKLALMPSGPIPPNPSDLLSSRRMRDLLRTLAEQYDVVLVDSPPVLAASDATTLAPVVTASFWWWAAGSRRCHSAGPRSSSRPFTGGFSGPWSTSATRACGAPRADGLSRFPGGGSPGRGRPRRGRAGRRGCRDEPAGGAPCGGPRARRAGRRGPGVGGSAWRCGPCGSHPRYRNCRDEPARAVRRGAPRAERAVGCFPGGGSCGRRGPRGGRAGRRGCRDEPPGVRHAGGSACAEGLSDAPQASAGRLGGAGRAAAARLGVAGIAAGGGGGGGGGVGGVETGTGLFDAGHRARNGLSAISRRRFVWAARAGPRLWGPPGWRDEPAGVAPRRVQGAGRAGRGFPGVGRFSLAVWAVRRPPWVSHSPRRVSASWAACEIWR